MFSYKIKMSFFDRLMFLITNEDRKIYDLVRKEKFKAYRSGKYVGVKIATQSAIISVKELAKYDVKAKLTDKGAGDLDVCICYRISDFHQL